MRIERNKLTGRESERTKLTELKNMIQEEVGGTTDGIQHDTGNKAGLFYVSCLQQIFAMEI
jgi:hypothetical protein